MGDNRFHTVRGYQLIDQRRKRLTPAMEDYLEMIYRQSREGAAVRVNALAGLLNVQPPSATRMVQGLTTLGMVNYKKYGIITLTDAGREMGQFLFARHGIIEAFLRNIGAGEDVMTETELIEHSISAHTVERLRRFNAFAGAHPGLIAELERYSGHDD